MNFVLGIIEQVSSGGGGGGGDDFPVLLDVVQTVITTTTATRNVVLPPTITAGQMILVFTSLSGGDVTGIPSGFTLLSGSTASVYKIAAGTEGGTSIAFTINDPEAITNSLACVIGSVNSAQAPATEIASGDDPPSITASWGAANNLVIASFNAVQPGSISAYPSNCSLAQETFTSTPYDAAIAAAETLLATFNPGAFSTSGQNGRARTFIIKGA